MYLTQSELVLLPEREDAFVSNRSDAGALLPLLIKNRWKNSVYN